MNFHTLHDQSFDELIAISKIPVAVLFTSPNCVPCKNMIPILHGVAEEFDGEIDVTQIDIMVSPKTTQQYAISSVPTILIFFEGKVVGNLIGVQNEEKICDMVEEILDLAQ